MKNVSQQNIYGKEKVNSQKNNKKCVCHVRENI